MTLTINDTTMTGDQTPHTARQAPSGHGWEVARLPGQFLDRNAAELGLTGHGSVARGPYPHGDISGQQKQDDERPDPDRAQ